MSNELRKEKKKLFKELEFYLAYYSEVSSRGKQIKDFYDSEINRIIERLKEIGNV
jgi:hypothetical protein